MLKYVSNSMLMAIKHNNIYPQSVDIRKNWFLCFNKIGLTAVRLTNKGESIKHINYWQNMSVNEINKRFNNMEWQKED